MRCQSDLPRSRECSIHGQQTGRDTWVRKLSETIITIPELSVDVSSFLSFFRTSNLYEPNSTTAKAIDAVVSYSPQRKCGFVFTPMPSIST